MIIEKGLALYYQGTTDSFYRVFNPVTNKYVTGIMDDYGNLIIHSY